MDIAAIDEHCRTWKRSKAARHRQEPALQCSTYTLQSRTPSEKPVTTSINNSEYRAPTYFKATRPSQTLLSQITHLPISPIDPPPPASPISKPPKTPPPYSNPRSVKPLLPNHSSLPFPSAYMTNKKPPRILQYGTRPVKGTRDVDKLGHHTLHS